MSGKQDITVWRQRLTLVAQRKNRKQTDETLFAAEAEIGATALVAVVDTLPLDDLRELAEMADASIGSPLLQFLTAGKWAELLDHQAWHEKLEEDKFSPFTQLLCGVFFRESLLDQDEEQGVFLDAYFRQKFDLIDPLLERLEEAFSNGRNWKESPFIRPPSDRWDPESLEPGSDPEDEMDSPRTRSHAPYHEDESEHDLGIFTRWYEANQGHDLGLHDLDLKHFLYRLCELRPEYAVALSDRYLRKTSSMQDSDIRQSRESAKKPQDPAATEESMF